MKRIYKKILSRYIAIQQNYFSIYTQLACRNEHGLLYYRLAATLGLLLIRKNFYGNRKNYSHKSLW